MNRTFQLAAIALALAGCNQEKRNFREIPPGAAPPEVVREGDLWVGGATPPESTITRYSDNAYALSQGQRLYSTMNCVGCHFHGGGGIGPPLMDDEWIYGGDPAQIFRTIVEGRPNGMPSFQGKLNNQQVWQLAAYVKSLSSGSAVSSAREDHMYLSPDLAIRPKEKPRGKTIPEP